MKNIKLLLATTAMLSMAVIINTKAFAVTQDFDVKVKLITKMTGLEKIDDLNFGQVYAGNISEAGKTVILSPSGTVSGTATHLGNAKQAVLKTTTVRSPGAPFQEYKIDITPFVRLYYADNDVSECGTVYDWQVDYSTPYDGTLNGQRPRFDIGATFKILEDEYWPSSGELISSSTECSGKATATLIYIGDN